MKKTNLLSKRGWSFLDGFQVQGNDSFIYTYSSWAGTWFGINPYDMMNKFNGFISDYDALEEDPPRPHINVKISNRCQAEALRQLINDAVIAQAEYNAAMNQCLIDAVFGTAALEIAQQGGFFKMILQQMKNYGGKGITGYRAAMWTLGFGSIAAAWCVNNNYEVLQAKYSQFESDFNSVYNQPCDN
ncbi:hypothetical protein [Spirosoma sp. KNUC1025]|uniref:hypothetical protein n=1 Tax=Spirosoma sp. KNUC1025 TaxID=2894082 RepID=UPI00386B6C57|nr:hypothetical protein LN737_29410 [Spirosoma sp. KNUC1025]